VGELFRDPRNTELETNLLHFERLYARILEERPAERRKLPGGDERREARAAYYDYVEAQLEDVRAKLERLREMPRRQAQ
jgi:hypothetical protein